jgi:hypothetical protein
MDVSSPPLGGEQGCYRNRIIYSLTATAVKNILCHCAFHEDVVHAMESPETAAAIYAKTLEQKG